MDAVDDLMLLYVKDCAVTAKLIKVSANNVNVGFGLVGTSVPSATLLSHYGAVRSACQLSGDSGHAFGSMKLTLWDICERAA